MFIISLLKSTSHGVLYLLFASFLFLLWGLLGQCFFGQPMMLEHSQQCLHHEEMIMSHELKKPLIVQSIKELFHPKHFNSWQSLSNTNDLVKRYPLKNIHQTTPLKNLLDKYYQRLQISKQIFFNLVQVVLLRFWIVLLFLPLFGLFGFLGFMDGLTQRHLRKRQGARESSVLYQHAKECLKPSLFGAGIMYIGTPLSLNPQILFLIFSVLFGLTLAIAARTYKKYL